MNTFTALLVCFSVVTQCSSLQAHNCGEGALRDDTKNGCVVADYTFTNSIQN